MHTKRFVAAPDPSLFEMFVAAHTMLICQKFTRKPGFSFHMIKLFWNCLDQNLFVLKKNCFLLYDYVHNSWTNLILSVSFNVTFQDLSLEKPDFLVLKVNHRHWFCCCSLVVDDSFSSDVMAYYVICFFSHLRLCLYLPLTETFFSFFLPLPAHYVVQPRGKSSQAHPGHPESGPRHRYLSPGL